MIAYRKVYKLWIPHSLTEEQKACRMKWCQEIMRNYENEVPRHLNNFVTGNETLLHYYNIRSKHNNQVVIWRWVYANASTKISINKKENDHHIFYDQKYEVLTRIVLEN